MELTDEEYIKMINKTFNKIGHTDSKPKTMAFMADGETQELEEPDGTFSSMNYVWKLIHKTPGKKHVLMNKQQAIRFIRVAKQRILKVLNTDIDFINLHLSRDERRAFDKKTNGRFIEKLTNRIRDVAAKYNITDADLYADTPKVLQKHIVSKMYEKPYVPNESGPPSPMYNPMIEPSPNYVPTRNYVPSPEYKMDAPNLSVLVKKSISEIKNEMDLIDVEDEEKYKEKDTPDILANIEIIKKEILNKFVNQVTFIPEEYYDKEVKELYDELIEIYTLRMTSIRKSAHFKYSLKFNPFNKKLVEVRRGKEKTRKQIYENYKKLKPNVVHVEPEPVPKPRPAAPKPRTRKPKTNATNSKKNVVPNGAKPNGAKPNGAKPNDVKKTNKHYANITEIVNKKIKRKPPPPRPEIPRVNATKKIKTNIDTKNDKALKRRPPPPRPEIPRVNATKKIKTNISL